MPDSVPRHFSLSGTPDATGPKSYVFFLPMLMVLLYAIVTWLARIPHVLNYPVDITPSNAKAQYENAAITLRILMTIILVQFSYITFAKINIAAGHSSALSGWILTGSISLIFAILAIFLVRAFSLKEK